MRIPAGFFSFDVKDTMRLIVWIIIAAFTVGVAYNQRAADMVQLRGVDELHAAKLADEAKIRERDVAEVKLRLDAQAVSIARNDQTSAQIASALDGIRTELRYVNEKIDVLRQEVRQKTRE